jgi:branched-subunit amino acid ABC-type transport system permease component
LVGIVMERGIIRFLYGRPLETLLATWGVSLILQQAVRTIFGPTNREVRRPAWMSGSVELGQLTLTWNRLWIIVFAMAVFAACILPALHEFGLQMRAVTEPEAWRVDGHPHQVGRRLTFGLGSGIAGIAGVALSQIDNVSAEPRSELHHRQLHGRGIRGRWKPVGNAGWRAHAGCHQQVPRAVLGAPFSQRSSCSCSSSCLSRSGRAACSR